MSSSRPCRSICWRAILQQEAVCSPLEYSAGYWTRVGTNVALPFGFTVGAQRRVSVDGLRGRVGAVRDPDNSAREDQTRILQATLLNRAITVYGFSPQVAVLQRFPRVQRATLRLQTQPRGTALRPAVLKSALSLLCSGRISCGLPSAYLPSSAAAPSNAACDPSSVVAASHAAFR